VKARGEEKKREENKEGTKKQKGGVIANLEVGINIVLCHYCIVTMCKCTPQHKC
jgi:hypothetical protein